MDGRWLQQIMIPGCKGLPWGSYCLVQGMNTSTWWYLSCVVVGVLVLEVSMTAELFPWEGVLLSGRVVTGVCSTVAVLTRVSGSGVVGIVGHNDVPHIPWLFLEGLPEPAVRLMSVTNLLISLCDAILNADEKSQEHIVKYYNCNTVENREKLNSIWSSYNFKVCADLSDQSYCGLN